MQHPLSAKDFADKWRSLVGRVRSRTKASDVLIFFKGMGACGSLVVKPEGRGFDTRCGEILNLPNPSGCHLLSL
jgi:hypothetical protein